MREGEARLRLFTGKGGVGKSSLVAASAMAVARAGGRALAVELGHRATLAALFGAPALTHDPVEVSPGVDALRIDFDEALTDYVTEHARVRSLARKIVRSDALNRFFTAAPAVAEVVTLRRLQRLEEESRDGRPRWDAIFVDLDATGHALMFLALPEVFAGLATSGPLARLLDSFTAMLSDPKRTALDLVTLPEELPAQETRELHAAVRAGGHVALGRLFINRVPPEPVSEPTRRAYDALVEAGLDGEVALARRLDRAHRLALDVARATERDLDLPTYRLPELPRFELASLAEALE